MDGRSVAPSNAVQQARGVIFRTSVDSGSWWRPPVAKGCAPVERSTSEAERRTMSEPTKIHAPADELSIDVGDDDPAPSDTGDLARRLKRMHRRAVARALALCGSPIGVAVRHERDRTLLVGARGEVLAVVRPIWPALDPSHADPDAQESDVRFQLEVAPAQDESASRVARSTST